MLITARARSFHACLLALLVVTGGLASGCQSSRPSFSFQAMPGRARAAAVAMPAAVPDSAAAVVASVARLPVAHADIQPPKRVRQRTRPAVASAVPRALAGIAPGQAEIPRPRLRPYLHRPHATAEVGLGTTVLGVLGLVVLPIALLGLLLSGGGLVWGIVAGVAALAVLVAYLDPFGQR